MPFGKGLIYYCHDDLRTMGYYDLHIMMPILMLDMKGTNEARNQLQGIALMLEVI